MRLRSLASSRELTLAVLVVALLGLTGSAAAVSAPEAPAVLAPLPAPEAAETSPTPTSTSSPTSGSTRVPKAQPPTRRAAPPVPRVPVVDAAPGRARPTDKRQWPDRLRSRDLDLDQQVRPVGVTKDGEMELPDTVKEVGWYRFGAVPGSRTGTTVLAAHVDTRAEGVGPFVRLQNAHEGDEVGVLDRSGREQRYRVVDVRSLSKRKIDWNQVFDRRGAPRLVLITCGGAYDSQSGYRDNVLVTAYPLS